MALRSLQPAVAVRSAVHGARRPQLGHVAPGVVVDTTAALVEGRMTEYVNTNQAANRMNITPGRFRSLAARAGIAPVAREPGRRGQNLYELADLDRIPRPGQGARTDLQEHPT